MTTYAVTAVSGQLGREIVRKLIDLPQDASVIGLARSPEQVTDLPIEVRAGDYDQPEQLETSLKGVDALVIVSGMAPPEGRIGQHRNVIQAARAAGVKKTSLYQHHRPREGHALFASGPKQPSDRGGHQSQRSGVGHRAQRNLYRAGR
ncbi:NAD(P)H-binding protein [Sulfitobacter sp. DSM 110093]|uniref:NAD(P)H-binding protein n=1 Tax=Sulfitobacter sp. DSM 110093 TaxID=2883127 RepID=UPI001FAC831A|nr:NAD(P)H-binding protein [Sulfitobacter sp. DSM 110093]